MMGDAAGREEKRILAKRNRLFSLSLGLICIITLEGKFKQLNPAWQKILSFEFVNCYLTNMKKNIGYCRDWLQTKDFEKIEKVAHTLKGSGSAMRLGRISEFGKTLEKSVHKKNWQRIKKSMAQLSSYLTHLEVMYVLRPLTSG